MLEGTSKGAGYRSFGDWAKNTIEPTPEPIKEKEEEVYQEELESEPIVEKKKEGDVVSTLLEKLSDFDWENEPIIRKKEKKEEPAVLPELEKIEEKIKSLVKEEIVEAINEEKEEVEEKREPVRKEEPKKPEPVPVKEYHEPEINSKEYRVFKDRDENFECQLSVEGTSLTDAKVRIVIESDSWNFVFYGQVYGDGKCVVPIKKGIPLLEGATGKIKLEVIAEDQLFVGWEDQFKVAASKKVKVELKEQKSVRVSFNNSLNETK
jgi:hypothetical protein